MMERSSVGIQIYYCSIKKTAIENCLRVEEGKQMEVTEIADRDVYLV